MKNFKYKRVESFLRKSIRLSCCLAIICSILALIRPVPVPAAVYSTDTIYFSKSITDIIYNGKNYTVKTITAYPNGEGKLLKTGSKLKAPYGRIKNFLYDLGITVHNIDESYFWFTTEICSFIYIYDTKAKDYRLAGNYNKAKSSVSVSIPYLAEKNGSILPDIDQKQYGEWISADDYGNTAKAIQCFNQGTVHNAYISSITIKDCDGKKLKTVSLKHPKSEKELLQ